MIQFTFPTAKTVLAVAALAIAPKIASSMVHAETINGRDVVTATVRYDDLNLASEQCKATLKSRIAMAVTKVCGSTGGTIDLAERIAVNNCRAKASHDAYAAAKLNGPVLASR